MNPIITDADTGRRLWTSAECADHCGVTTSTWRSYNRTSGRMNPPAPVTHLDQRTPLWDAADVQEWHAHRPGSPVPNNPADRT